MGSSRLPAKEVMIKEWTKKAACLDIDTNFFFDKYEESVSVRHGIDKMCADCPVRRQCISIGVTRQEYGVWGGVYLEKGKISKEMNNHKNENSWFDLWSSITMEVL